MTSRDYFTRSGAIGAILVSALVLVAGSTLAAKAGDVTIDRVTPVNTPTVFTFNSFVTNCAGVAGQNLAKPAIVLVPERPAHGAIEKHAGQAPVKSCPGQLGYATIVTYTPERNFAGYDHFQLRNLFNLRAVPNRALSM